ncbi:YhgE/Pip domain-containing protein [Lipingzhangella sp. LS1_29]|uniref:YhgE/Pip domain-containing protein n=1 Tax=Lipingzhangella rawalii TaxID=2055835 RepID=A0ABU2HAA1_9ACTN|nr:YhgE/Pip domain-containing protein [Lipingzhangella rawalii]MDS1272191.1 YhgE/Pip domain-containing protein [Lipingzhangella rawalii]
MKFRLPRLPRFHRPRRGTPRRPRWLRRPRFLPTARATGPSVLSYLRSPLPTAALAALTLIPLLYAGLYLWAFWDPFGGMKNLPVALVNDDEPATVDGEELAAGDELTEELLDRGDLDWHLVDDTTAEEGVDDGRFYVALRIPQNFSANLATPGEDDPRPVPAQLETYFNDANSYIVRELLGTAFADVQSAAGRSAIETYLDDIFLGFNEIHDQTGEAADGADELADGTDSAQDGSEELHEGLGEAASGSDELSDGLGELYSGSVELADGASTASAEVHEHVTTLDQLADTVVPRLREDAPAIEDGANDVAHVAGTIADALDELPQESEEAAEAAHEIDQAVTDYLHEHPELESEEPELYDLLIAVDSVASQAVAVNNFVTLHAADISTLAEDAEAVADTAANLAAEAPQLAEDAEYARDRIDELDEGLAELATGSGELRDGLADAHGGAVELDGGIGELRTGAGELDSGLTELSGGAQELATGLAEGLGLIPTYDEDSRDRHGDMMSEPVRLSSTVENEAPDYGTGFAPFFIPLSLWVGAMVVYMVLPATVGRALASSAPSWRVAFISWLPALGIGVVQVAVMMAVLHFGLGLSATRWLTLIALLLLTAAAFTAMVQWLNVQFNSAGRVLALVLLMLQLTSSGGTYPLETSPALFQAIAHYLPMNWVVSALRHLISGGDLTVVLNAFLVLGAYLVGALTLTVLAVSRKRVWSMHQLHPSLKL